MKIFKVINFILICSLFVTHCKKENNNDLIHISGITETDELGYCIGRFDIDDWRINDIWTLEEKNLFQPINDNNFDTLVPQDPPGVTAYPNPGISNIIFEFKLYTGINYQYTGMYYDIRIVNSQLARIYSRDSGQDISIVIPYNTSFAYNNLYRLYYRLYTRGVEFRGHGDFMFKNK